MIINDKAFNVCVCETLRLFDLIRECKGTYNRKLEADLSTERFKRALKTFLLV